MVRIIIKCIIASLLEEIFQQWCAVKGRDVELDLPVNVEVGASIILDAAIPEVSLGLYSGVTTSVSQR